MKRCFATLAVCLYSISGVLADEADNWKPVAGQLLTRWAADVRPDHVLPEYPRPQMTRPDWLNLNGLWDYAITPAAQQVAPQAYDGRILVPFCVESALSGVKKPVKPDQTLWYRHQFQTPADWRNRRVLLHFGAVDWSTQVWVNGKSVGTHQGGYDPFDFDITDALVADGPQTLVVQVTDPTDTSWQPRGKQILEPHGIWYTAVTGIWQTVWLEPVPKQHIRGLTISPRVASSEVAITADVVGGGRVRVEVRDAGELIASGQAPAMQPATLRIPDAKLWSPDSPHLYDVTVTTVGADETDAVGSYFGMREISIGEHHGYARMLLNGQPLFQFGPLDQGWWPDGLYTAPTDAALRYDLEVLKQLGMNMLRKHVKVEPARLYYHCDKLGLLVWQDMPSGDQYIRRRDPDIKRTPVSGKNFERELKAMIDTLRNHPSIIMWVLYNEGWGQWDTERLTTWIKSYDATRLVSSASGWADRGTGDIIDLHVYPGPVMRPPEAKRASVVGEFGGLGCPVTDHLWLNNRHWGYRTYETQAELQNKYLSTVEQLLPLLGQGLSAAVYTQTTDVEGEINGLMTYDRAVLKLDQDTARALHRRLYVSPPMIREIVSTSLEKPQKWRYTFDAPANDWMQPSFDDSAWETGPGMFGTYGTPGVRLGTPWQSADIWLRREFELSPSVVGSDLRLMLYHDEDVEIYINGVEAASVQRWVTSHKLVEISEAARATMRAGSNTLAVHCHQTSGGQGIDVGLSQVVK